VTRPAGVEALEATGGGRTPLESAAFDAPSAAGTYFFIKGGRRVGALVVNAEVDESRLERWSHDDLEERVASRSVRVADNLDDWSSRAFSGAARRSLVVPLLVGVLLLLGVEAVAATVGGRGQ
jgi:hypothetical protein